MDHQNLAFGASKNNRIILDDGVTYQLIHADEKHDGRGHNHAEYLLSALESPQSGA